MLKIEKKPLYLYELLFYIAIVFLTFYTVLRGSFGFFYTTDFSRTVRYSPGNGYGALVVLLTCISLAFIMIDGIIFFNKTVRYFSDFQIFNIFIFFALILIWTSIDMLAYGFDTIVTQTISCFIYALVVGVFIGAEDEIWRKLKSISFYLSLLFIVLAFVYILWFIAAYGGRIGNSPQIIYLSTGFWPLAISALCFQYEKKWQRYTIPVLLIFALLTSVIYVSRGWIIQCALLITVYVVKTIKVGKRNANPVKAVVIIAMIFTAALIIIINFFPDYFALLLGRLEENTRSWQYQEIFEQTDFWDLLFGQGTMATYVSSQYGDYKYIDNNFIYIFFHYGFFFMAAYFFFLFAPVIRGFKTRGLPFLDRMPCIVLILWLLSLNGLSVYNSPMIDIKTFFIVLLVGRVYRTTSEYAKKRSGFLKDNSL